jgi:hypothetical protein
MQYTAQHKHSILTHYRAGEVLASPHSLAASQSKAEQESSSGGTSDGTGLRARWRQGSAAAGHAR